MFFLDGKIGNVSMEEKGMDDLLLDDIIRG
jgi:hypothetical protein